MKNQKKAPKAKNITVEMSGTVVQPDRDWATLNEALKVYTATPRVCQSDAHQAALAQASPCPDCSKDQPSAP